MRVALVYPLPFGDEGAVGGGERYAIELARAMAARVETVLVTIASRRKRERVGALRIETYPWRALLHGLRQNPLSLGFLAGVFDADVIHALSYHTLLTDLCVLFGRLSRKKVFITDVGGGGDLSLARWINITGLSSGLLLLSDFARRTFVPNSCPRHVIYGGVDTARFVPGTGARRRQVLFVGRMLSHKGVDYLLRATDPEVPLVIAGRPYDARYVQHLHALAAGKAVTFLTAAEDEQVIAAYQSSAVVAVPSVYRDAYGKQSDAPELLGLSALEAMACGTPVVATDVGSLPELIEDGVTGFVVPPNDPVAMGDRIRFLLDHPATAAEMGVRGRARVESAFTWSTVVDRCLAIYQGAAA